MINLEKGEGLIIHGTYKVVERIGRGGTSRVYLVQNLRTGQNYALKEVAKFDKDGTQRQLVTEDKILKNLYHPNMPRIIDVFEDEAAWQIVMDYVAGTTLQKKVFEDGAQSEEDVVAWGIQLCDVLEYLHSQVPPIIYRDMKPSNIMLRAGTNQVVLIDFGTARKYKENRLEDTQVLGTHGYAAPEQEKGLSQTDERTDIYNLGATLFHLVVGKSPAKIKAMKPIRTYNPDLSSGLEQIILKCTKPDPDDRYQSCKEVKEALLHYHELDDGYIAKQKRHVALFVAACILSIFCFAGAFYFMGQKNSASLLGYDSLIRSAESTDKEEEKRTLYARAISVDPGRPEAYTQFLSYCLSDGNFTGNEAAAMQGLLNTRTGSSTAENAFEKTDKYAGFCYQLGIAYFYYYAGSGNKSLAKPWFGAAIEAGGLTGTQKLRAQRFFAVASYYDTLDIKDKAGDSTVSYGSYWDDLDALTSGNIVQSDNVQTAFVMYREAAGQIIMHAWDFKKAGVTRTEMDSKLADMESRLKTDIERSPEYTDDMKENVNSLTSLYAQAKNSIASAFFKEE